MDPDRYEVWSDAWPVLQIFLDLRNKWEMVAAPDGELIRTGIRNADLDVALRLTGGLPKKKFHEVYRHILAMEGAALEVLNRARAERREERERERERRAANK